MTPHRIPGDLFNDYPKEVILKDGTGVTLRPLRKGDERPLFEMFKRFSADDLWFLDHDVSDRELIAEWITDLDLNRRIATVALLEGHIVANAVLMLGGGGAESHIGKIRISVDPSCRDKRLGTWMLLDLINLAIAIGLKMLVMRLVQDRDAAVINGIKKLEFAEKAILKDYLRGREGKPHNLVIMTKRLPSRYYDF